MSNRHVAVPGIQYRREGNVHRFRSRVSLSIPGTPEYISSTMEIVQYYMHENNVQNSRIPWYHLIYIRYFKNKLYELKISHNQFHPYFTRTIFNIILARNIVPVRNMVWTSNRNYITGRNGLCYGRHFTHNTPIIYISGSELFFFFFHPISYVSRSFLSPS